MLLESNQMSFDLSHEKSSTYSADAEAFDLSLKNYSADAEVAKDFFKGDRNTKGMMMDNIGSEKGQNQDIIPHATTRSPSETPDEMLLESNQMSFDVSHKKSSTYSADADALLSLKKSSTYSADAEVEKDLCKGDRHPKGMMMDNIGSEKGEVSIINHKTLNTGYTFKVMEGTECTWKTFAATKVQYPKELNSYLMGKDLPQMLSVMSGCKVNHNILGNFVEEGNVKYIECGDLEGAVCYDCNKEFKKKASKRYVTLSKKEPAYTCENRNKGCRLLLCFKCFSGKNTKEAPKKSRRTSSRMCKKYEGSSKKIKADIE